VPGARARWPLSTRRARLFDAQLAAAPGLAAANWSGRAAVLQHRFAGHEACALAARCDDRSDPAHYRSGAFYLTRAAQVPPRTAAGRAARVVASVDERSPAAAQVFGNKAWP